MTALWIACGGQPKADAASGSDLLEGYAGLRILEMNSARFSVADSIQPYWDEKDSPLFQFTGQLKEGELFLEVQTRSESGTRAPHLRARKLFDLMMRFFETQQQPVHAIHGNWDFGDNLMVFNERIQAGDTPSTAALATWTGQQALRHGFDHVQIKSLIGRFGQFQSVRVLYQRSGHRKDLGCMGHLLPHS